MVFYLSDRRPLLVVMVKEKEPKRLCRCGCGKMLSARAEHRHRDGEVPPRIAAVQGNQRQLTGVERHLSQSIKRTVVSTVASSSHQVETSDHLHDDNIDIDMLDSEHHSMPSASPFDNSFGPNVTVPEETIIADGVEPATATIHVNRSVGRAKAAVWTEWRARRENATVSDDDEDDEDNDLPGLVIPEDDEDSDSDEDSEPDEECQPDYQSVDDQIEAEWENEWAEMGQFLFFHNELFALSKPEFCYY